MNKDKNKDTYRIFTHKQIEKIKKEIENLSPQAKQYIVQNRNIVGRLVEDSMLSKKEKVYKKFVEFKVRHGVVKGYDLLDEYLRSRDLDPEDYDMNYEPETFNRALNKYRKNHRRFDYILRQIEQKTE